jgi:hypothetical protein
MRHLTLAVGLALTLVMAVALPASAGDQRPFKSRYSGHGVAAEQRCGPNALTLGFAVTGVATHVGRYTVIGTNCTEFGLATEAVDIWDSIFVVEAADGSTLTFSGEGSQSAPVNGVAWSTQTITVVSGSGRFADAAGVLALSGPIDFSDLSISGTVSGWLSY